MYEGQSQDRMWKVSIGYRYSPGRLTHLLHRETGHTDRHFVSTASCVKTTHAPTDKLGCHEIETNISTAYENLAIFSRRKLLIVSDLLHLNMEVTVPEPCDVIRVSIGV